APIASAVRIVSAACCGPIEIATISVAAPFSLSRIASSTAISSKGFIDILTLASSAPEPSALTRTLTLKSTTRLTGTNIFMPGNSRPARRANYGPPRGLSTRSPAAFVGWYVGPHVQRVSRPHAIEQPQFRAPQDHDQHGAGQHPADVRPPGGIALVRHQHVPDLRQSPEPENPCRPEPQRHDAEGEHQNPRAGPQDEVGGDHAGDGAGGADQRNGGVGVDEDVHQAAG